MIDPLFPPGLSIIVALIVLGVLVFFEVRRKQRFLLFRIVAQALIVTSVFLLTLRPSTQITNHQSRILLTSDHEQKLPDSLSSFERIKVSSYNELSKLNGIKVIAGNGLPSWALDILPSKNYSFIPSSQPTGITAIETDEHVYAHRWNTIRGTWHGDGSLIKLRGPGGIEDSVKTSANGESFTLSFFAKAPGRFNYELITPKGSETLPLVIEPERVFNVIVVNNYPTFELRYLKNFLTSEERRVGKECRSRWS